MGQTQSNDLSAHVDALCANDIPTNSEQWATLWATPVANPTDLFEALPASTVRRLRTKNPANFAKLISKLVAQLRLALTSKPDDAATHSTTLHCVRLLTRLVPIAFEDQASGFVERVFWQAAQDQQRADGDASSRVPLAITLLDTLVALLFLPGFTINEFAAPPPTLAQLRQHRNAVLPAANVWAGGVGGDEVFPSDAAHCANRVEVLKLLLACLAGAMYRPGGTQRYANSWLHYVCTRPTYYTAGLFKSLLNVVCTYDPVGWGLPYNYLLFSDPREELTYTALQMLTVLLEYEAPAEANINNDSTSTSNGNNNNNSNSTNSNAPAKQDNNNNNNNKNNKSSKNVFARYLASVPPSSFEFVFNGLVALLSNPHDASRTYLPGSTKELFCQQEALSVMWRVLLGAPALTQWLLNEADEEFAPKLLRPVLLFMLESRRDEANLGVVHLGTFIMLLLSGERSFGLSLNAPFNQATDSLGRIDGTLSDLLVLTVSKILVDSHDRLASLHECLLTIIANISPYVKTLNAAASAKLLQLFDMFSKAKFLLGAERHPRYAFFLVETFNNIIQYQYEGNEKLIYSIVRYADAFKRLDQFSLESSEPNNAQSVEKASKEGENPPPVVASAPASAAPAFVPTSAWVTDWKSKMPLGTILRLLDTLLPVVEKLVDGTADDNERILEHLRKTTLVGVLPVPHPILIRKYQHNAATSAWFRNFMWGFVFTRNTQPPIFYGTKVRLFTVSIV